MFLHNNTLSRAELSDSRGSVLNLHYGDILIKFGTIINPSADPLPRIADGATAGSLSCDSLRDGDVIVADTAEDLTAGKCSELRGVGGLKVVAGLHTMPLRPLREYAPGYLGHYLNAPAFRGNLVPLMQGVKVISISRSAVAGASLLVPSFVEQCLIGSLLSFLDSLITLHQRK